MALTLEHKRYRSKIKSYTSHMQNANPRKEKWRIQGIKPGISFMQSEHSII